MSSFVWPAVPTLAVLAPIEQTPSETRDDLRMILCTESREIPVCRTMSEIDTRRSDRMKVSIAAIVALVVATTCRPGRFLSTMLSLPRANFVHQTCIVGLVKHLSPYTGRISE